jgi:adenine-specific DNA-methyltransferase
MESVIKMIKNNKISGLKIREISLDRKYVINVIPEIIHFQENNTTQSLSYIGSKIKLLEFLIDNIKKYTNKEISELSSFGDFFSGTGVVSNLIARLGCKNIICSDIQYYSYIISSVITTKNINTKKIKELLLELNEISIENPSSKDFVYNNYTNGGSDRLYLSASNGLKCDRIRQKINVLFEKKCITLEEYNLLVKILLYAVSKVSNIAGVYGAYLKKFKPSSLEKLSLKEFHLDNLIDNRDIDVVCECKPITKQLNQKFIEAVYLDPPYNQRNYSTNYHLLETIAKYDYPKIRGKTGLRDYEDKESKLLCSKKNVYKEFFFITSNINSRYLFISYNNDGLLSKEEITEILEKNWKNIKIIEKTYQKFISNSKTVKENVVEYLFCCEKINV